MPSHFSIDQSPSASFSMVLLSPATSTALVHSTGGRGRNQVNLVFTRVNVGTVNDGLEPEAESLDDQQNRQEYTSVDSGH